MRELYTSNVLAVVSVTVLVALWSASRGVFGILNGINSILGSDEYRSYLRRRMTAIFYTFLLILALFFTLGLQVFGRRLVAMAEDWDFWLADAVSRLVQLRKIPLFLPLTAALPPFSVRSKPLSASIDLFVFLLYNRHRFPMRAAAAGNLCLLFHVKHSRPAAPFRFRNEMERKSYGTIIPPRSPSLHDRRTVPDHDAAVSRHRISGRHVLRLVCAVPRINSLKISWPISLVPSQCSALGF